MAANHGKEFWVGLLMGLVGFGAGLAGAAETPPFLEKILSLVQEELPSVASVPVRLVVDDPWQAVPRVGVAGLRPVRIWLEAKPRQLQERRLELSLTARSTGQIVWTVLWPAPKSAVLDLTKIGYEFAWGAYELRAVLQDAGGRPVYSTSALITVLPDDQHKIEVLNNLVSELANARRRQMLGQPEIAFMNPRDGWCWFQLAGTAKLRLNEMEQPLLESHSDHGTMETMRFLPAGRHQLRIEGQPTELVVRAVPVLFYNVYQTGTQIAPFGLQTWELLEKVYWPACNMIEGTRVYQEETSRWRAMGRRWVLPIGVPEPPQGQVRTVETLLDHWQRSDGYSHPLADGMQIDEFTARYSDAEYALFAEGVRRLAADRKFQGRLWIPFVTIDPDQPGRRAFFEALMEAGWPVSLEIYLPEKPTAQLDQAEIERRMAGRLLRWEKLLPAVVRRTIVCPMFSSLPYCMTNTLPNVDFKVHLEMQLHHLATHPALFGLYGLQPYRSNYADPETLRWMGRLLRHYGIEGRRDRLGKDPYELVHLQNPDFEQGMKHWEVQAAELGGIRTGSYRGLGALEGRWPPSEPVGNNFLIFRRSPKGPNRISQTIQALQPGRLYCLKMISADYQDLVAGRSQKTPTGLSILLEGVQLEPGQSNQFDWPFRSFQPVGPFSRQKPFWMTYHWRVFRAQGTRGRLTISDWPDAQKPGGPAGQEVLVHFVELQPYFSLEGQNP
ncbi:MAG: hypothetical protein RMI90_15745 [Thermoguttaceae bacterium]|nr:hypothetical protein [Thermoguttaceae bacterium]